MKCAFKTTVKFVDENDRTIRVQYAVSARSMAHAREELERRFSEQDSFRYEIEQITHAGINEIGILKLPEGSVQFLDC